MKGVTDNITIRSIVGRFLEHSRIYIFGAGVRKKVYISSADYMTRNTTRRVEVGVPILDEDIAKRVLEYFDIQMHDNVKARIMNSRRHLYTGCTAAAKCCSQEKFMAMAYENAPPLDAPPPGKQLRRYSLSGKHSPPDSANAAPAETAQPSPKRKASGQGSKPCSHEKNNIKRRYLLRFSLPQNIMLSETSKVHCNYTTDTLHKIILLLIFMDRLKRRYLLRFFAYKNSAS